MGTMFMAMNVGATALIARAKGAGDQKRANLILRQAILLTAVLSAAASVLGFIYAEPLIKFMGAADEQTLAGGTIYLQIQMVGMVVFALTSTFTAALRGVGNSRIAMTYNLIANLVNVVFNYCLIFGHSVPKIGSGGSITGYGNWPNCCFHYGFSCCSPGQALYPSAAAGRI